MTVAQEGAPVALQRYHAAFRVRSNGRMTGLELGAGTLVTIRSLALVPAEVRPTSLCDDYDVVAVVELRLRVAIERTAGAYHRCSTCFARPPLPDLDACWYLLENHGSDRIAFAAGEDAARSGDEYPVAGWRKIDGELHCAACVAEIQATKDAIRARRVSP